MDTPLDKLPKPTYTEKLINMPTKRDAKPPQKFKYLDGLLSDKFKEQYFNKK
jgi:hypothetical protein